MQERTYTQKEVRDIIEAVYDTFKIESSDIYKNGFEAYLNGMGLNGNNGAGEAYDEEYYKVSIDYFI